MTLSRRLQLLLDEDRYQKIAAVASEQQRSVASVIREAIDRSLSAPSSRRAAAGQSILAAEPADVPDLDELRRELDEMHTKHA